MLACRAVSSDDRNAIAPLTNADTMAFRCGPSFANWFILLLLRLEGSVSLRKGVEPAGP